MSRSRSYMAFVSLMFLAGLAGCGSASSDNASNHGPRASVGEQPLPKQDPSPRIDQVTPAASPVPRPSENQTGVASEKRTVTGGDSPTGVPVQPTKPTDELEPLVVPTWMAKELDSPDVGTRLRALDQWVQSAPPGAVDPLILALENKDERVRARAMELIEQDWARSADSEQ